MLTLKQAFKLPMFWLEHDLLAIQCPESDSGWITVSTVKQSLWQRPIVMFSKTNRNMKKFTPEDLLFFPYWESYFKMYEDEGFSIPWNDLIPGKATKRTLQMRIL